ncbi:MULTISPECIES: PEP-CTERM sorting domain-containing protein [unclassified Colwellia]|uniref:PEP-CTERM sorting domain-containing protein n=1 Tax=unclassified Colwellia TaxID=196834 RepID=UPI0015F5229E|nr:MULTISPECIES: PEP-CTERM sorting domain-containing protein [unclassified Colwellia]MBA6347966.1 PEP-CTERM sorting domain-containing protein [Colwellia sp. BRX8-9]MBA6381254.1 PEP-CTERM sorting domain-containing protein [Colwellia sp. BRX10-7]MBA6388977.1 PEP-CTERM sorting domain-containing protein [Colwellia sp. BRX10-2]MBA6403730.1 PEP-CTERM sorting domain-containing protein [Colwellia sp. BRX10-5]MBA6407630.1 PEP-CTERM sorting domain-containing protein [Colwellia sp. BRX10-1]
MSSKIINIVVVCVLSLFVADRANAGLIIGDLYSDDTGIQWEYIGSFDVTGGDDYSLKPATYNGIEAAEFIFGQPTIPVSYALSTNVITDYTNIEDYIVNKEAFYQQYRIAGVTSYDQARATNLAGGIGYDAEGDVSAYVYDRAFEGIYFNYVFKSVTTSVPEPSTIAIFSLALIGLVSRRFKN